MGGLFVIWPIILGLETKLIFLMFYNDVGKGVGIGTFEARINKARRSAYFRNT